MKKVIALCVFLTMACSLTACDNRTLGAAGGAAVGGTVGGLAGGTTGAVVGGVAGAAVGSELTKHHK